MNEILTKKVLASENRQGGLYALLDTAQGQRCSATGSGESFDHNDGSDGGAQSFLVSKGAKSDILRTDNVENNYFCTFNSAMDNSNFDTGLTSNSVVNNSNVLDSSNVDMNNSNIVVDNSENALVADDNDTVVEALFSTRFKLVYVDTWHKRLGHPQNLVITHLQNAEAISVIGNSGPIEKSTVEKGLIENSSPAQLIDPVLNPGSVLSTGPDQFSSTVETTDPVPSAGPSSSGQPLDSTLAEFAGGC
ncbi:hypothetical protein NE237_026111 [Protea cynaroides]|uniref:GAG-pre-integrase domain-containing protein n=1 Tax=Protea cynaroides TaxID=273540 RepID=A0A9Q0K1Z1_9MAGN|nr:hypothetical protein NE237_026111 [Protea cynaroides]